MHKENYVFYFSNTLKCLRGFQFCPSAVWEISKINIQNTYLYLLILQFQEKTDEVTNKFLDKRKDSYQSKPQPLATVHIDEDLNEIKHTVIYF